MINKETKILTFNNQKGGVCKSTMTLNTAYILTKKGYKTLIIDLDPQGNIATSLGFEPTEDSLNHFENLLEPRITHEEGDGPYTFEEISKYIYQPSFTERQRINGKWVDVETPFGFDITIPTPDLSMLDLYMSLYSKGKIYPYYIWDLCEVIKKKDIYDFILIDTPPSLGSLSISAIVAAKDGIIIPSTLELNSFKGIRRLIRSVEELKEICEVKGPHRGILGIGLTAFREGRNVDKELKDYVREYYPTPTFKNEIRETADARKATAAGFLLCQMNDKAAADYEKFVNELLDAINNPDEFNEKNKALLKAAREA